MEFDKCKKGRVHPKKSGQHNISHFAGEKCTLPAQLGVKVLTYRRTLFFALGISMVQSHPFLKNADPTTANYPGRCLSDLWRQLGRVVQFHSDGVVLTLCSQVKQVI